MTDAQFRYLMSQLANNSGGGGGGPRVAQNTSGMPDFTYGTPPTRTPRPSTTATAAPTSTPYPQPPAPAGGIPRDQFGRPLRDLNGNIIDFPALKKPQGEPNLPNQDNSLPPPANMGPDDLYPNVTPTPYPSHPYQYQGMPNPPNVPHEGMNVPPGTFNPPPEYVTPATDLPFFGGDGGRNEYVTDPGSYNTPTNEFMDPTPIDNYEMYQNYDPGPGFQESPMPDFPNNPPDFSGGFDTTGEMQNPPGGGYDYGGGGFDFSAPTAGETDSDQFLQDIPTNYVEDPFRYDPSGSGTQSPFSYDPSFQGEDQPAPTPAPFYAPSPDTGLPGPSTPQNTGFTGAPASMPLDPNDPNNNLIRGGISMPLYPTSQDVFPGASSSGVGGFFKDAAGNIIDATGKLIMTAATAAAQAPGQLSNLLGGIANNIMNDPGYSSPDYLASMGYSRDNAYQPMWPGQASTSGFGVEGRGGSFFGGTMNFNPMGGDISGSNNPFGAGQVGSSSVPAPQGGMAFVGGGSFANPSALGGANARGKMLAERIRQAIIAGTYRPPPFGGPVYKYPSPVLQKAGIAMARNMGMVRTSGHPGGTMSFAYPNATPVNWTAVGLNWRNALPVGGNTREPVPLRQQGGPHAHTPPPSIQ